MVSLISINQYLDILHGSFEIHCIDRLFFSIKTITELKKILESPIQKKKKHFLLADKKIIVEMCHVLSLFHSFKMCFFFFK